MNRDSFWENIGDILKLVAKLVVIMFAVQIILMVSGNDSKIPYVYSFIMSILNWMTATFGTVRYGM